MDMYQKRKMRAKNNNLEEKSTNVEINCEEWTNAKLHKNVEK